jgi:hypothetical protein
VSVHPPDTLGGRPELVLLYLAVRCGIRAGDFRLLLRPAHGRPTLCSYLFTSRDSNPVVFCTLDHRLTGIARSCFAAANTASRVSSPDIHDEKRIGTLWQEKTILSGVALDKVVGR